MMRQHNALKAKYPNTILLFRVGDFYETFGDDAILASKILGITLTRRANGAASEMELAGFPYHAVETYLPRLVKAGQRVAVVDQLEDPKLAKGIVKRGVTDIVTPGTALADPMLEGKRNNYLAALHFTTPQQVAMAFLELSTGDFFCLTGGINQLEKLLFSLRPAEIVLSRTDMRQFKSIYGDDFYLHRVEDWVFDEQFALEHLLRHFNARSLKGFGLEEIPQAAAAAGVLVHYLHENEQHKLGHIGRIYPFPDEDFVALDRFTLRNLELLSPMHPDGKALADILDQTLTPMGARMLRRWISFPLRKLPQILQRQGQVTAFLWAEGLIASTAKHLSPMGDLERLVTKLATRRINPRECQALRNALKLLEPLKETLENYALKPFHSWLVQLQTVAEPLNLLTRTLAENCPPNLSSGGVIAAGVLPELDELRTLQTDGSEFLERMRAEEAERTGISSLKISFNRVFGYYIEITHTHRERIPSDYIRKQTLANAERYITPALKTFEEKILSAEERLLRLETEAYTQLLEQLQPFVLTLQTNAALLAELDVLLSLAVCAEQYHYAAPDITEEDVLDIVQGRHPVIERLLPRDAPYVPNDVMLTCAERQVLIITGPNMAGKSALLRQTALIVLMAQMGSYVPAQSARIGLVDKIFTRVGASDNLSQGESTFMVEMNETARIMNAATRQSLILLDEIGRGTSTYDGVAIAWALVEYLHNHAPVAAKTLFATHYHELAALAEQLPRVHNCHVAVKEIDGRIIFLRRLESGSSEHSFGIQVAEMAGMPPSIVGRAKALLAGFEERAAGKTGPTTRLKGKPALQMHLFSIADDAANRVRKLLRDTDVNRLTPIEALLKLEEIKRALEEKMQ